MQEANDDAHKASPTADELLARCEKLWDELELFRAHLKQQRKENTVELSHYRGVVKSEIKNLERLVERSKDIDRQPPLHNVASSNLPFLEAVWTSAKASSGLVALQKRFYHGPVVVPGEVNYGRLRGRGRGAHSQQVRKDKALVDVVARDGLEWIKVSLVSNHRMIMDKAREGWAGASDDSEDGEESDASSNGDSGSDDDDPDRGIPLVRMAESLAKAALGIRVRTQHPLVRIILPKITEGEEPAVDAILERLRKLGLCLECGDAVPKMTGIEEAMTNLVTDDVANLTPTLNIDCTILLALVSDFSHCVVSAEPWFHRALKRQVEIEDKENLLPTTLYPAICDRHLVCTEEAVKRMREIVDTIGTEGEKVRTSLYMGDDTTKGGAELRASLQEWSKFQVPESLALPLRVVSKESATRDLPAVATIVMEGLTPINQSVFGYGWSTEYTTITSNRTVVKQIDALLDKHAESDKDWPKIWMCPTARSLVGKEKGRRD